MDNAIKAKERKSGNERGDRKKRKRRARTMKIKGRERKWKTKEGGKGGEWGKIG